MIVEDKQGRIKCSFIEIKLPFQQGASWSSTENNRFIKTKASLAREPRGSNMQSHLKLGRWSHDNQDQELKRALLLYCFLSKDTTAAGSWLTALLMDVKGSWKQNVPSWTFFLECKHVYTDSLKSEHPHGYCSGMCAISYLLGWENRQHLWLGGNQKE